MADSNWFAKEQARSCDSFFIARWRWKRIKEKISVEVEPCDLEKDDDLHKLIKYMGSHLTWWRHQMETFSALLDLCMGNSLVTSAFP